MDHAMKVVKVGQVAYLSIIEMIIRIEPMIIDITMIGHLKLKIIQI